MGRFADAVSPILFVACVSCDARPGHPCVVYTGPHFRRGWPTVPHMTRIQSAEAHIVARLNAARSNPQGGEGTKL